MGGPVRLSLFVACAIAVGCGSDEPSGTDCSDPLGGELRGVFVPSDSPPITMGTMDPWPTLTHIEATSDHPSGTYLSIVANHVFFNVVLSGDALETFAVAGMRYSGEGTVALINSCPPRTVREARRVTGTVSMVFNGQPIDGWFNANFDVAPTR